MDSKNIFEVKIAGIPLKIRSSHSQDSVDKLVRHVDEKIAKAMAVNKSGSFQDSMLLALLNMAEELAQVKQQARTELGKLHTKARTIASELESSRVGLNS